MHRRDFVGGATAAVAAALAPLSLSTGCAPEDGSLNGPSRSSSAGVAYQQGDHALAVAPDGSSAQIDGVDHVLVRFDRAGRVQSYAGGQGVELGELNGPRDLAFAPNGDCWVLDAGNQRLQRFNAAGEFVTAIETGPACAFVANAQGALFVADHVGSRILSYDSGGTLIREVPLPASPRDLARAPDGSLVVLHRNGTVVRYDTDGNTLAVLVRDIVLGTAVAVDPSGRVFVADAGTNSVSVFNAQGRPVDVIEPVLDDGRVGQPLGVSLNGTTAYFRVAPGELPS